MIEIWKAIPGYEGYYEVSDLGRVRSLDREIVYSNGAKHFYKGTILHLSDHEHGYKIVSLCDGYQITCSVHELVLMTFIGLRPPDKPHSRHLNGDPSDNRLENLAWGTVKENSDDRVGHGTNISPKGENHGNAKLTDENVISIRKLLSEGAKGKMLAEEFGVSKTTISEIKHKKVWRHLK